MCEHLLDLYADELNASSAVKGQPRVVSFDKKVQEKEKSSAETDESSSDDENDKHKGVDHLIEIENPNRVQQKMKKVTDLKLESTELTRRER